MSNSHKSKTVDSTDDPVANRHPHSSEAAAPASAEDESEASVLARLQADLEQTRDLALRTRADFDNFRKRAAREKEETIQRANSDLLEKLIPIIDNFELGLGAANDAQDAAAIRVGFEMVYKQLQGFLAAQGVEVIDATGKEFDHNLHEALGQESSDEVPEDHVIRQLRKGYKLRDRLIRPANVFISKGNA